MKVSNQINIKSKALILGSGINQISAKDLSVLEDLNKINVIGGNLCFLEHRLDFFISSYFVHCELCSIHNSDATIIKLSTVNEDKIYANEKIKTFYGEHLGIHPGLILKGYISTEFNQLIGMTHFASSLGVNEIIYSGFDQTNYKYFWQVNKKHRQRVNKLIDELELKFKEDGYNQTDLDRKVFNNIKEHLNDTEDFDNYEFYNNSIIKAIFSDLESMNITFRTLDANGIIKEILNECS